MAQNKIPNPATRIGGKGTRRVPSQTGTTAAAAKTVLANKAVAKAKAAKSTTTNAAIAKKQLPSMTAVRAKAGRKGGW